MYFKIGENEIVTLQEGPHKFLGSNLTFSGKQSDIFDLVHGYFETRLKRIDSLLIREDYKVKMFRDYVIPSSRFLLTVHEITYTNLDKLDALCNKFLKKWMHMPQSAAPEILKIRGLAHVPSVKQTYQECQVSSYISSMTKADASVTHCLISKLRRESQWTRKNSVTHLAQETMDALPGNEMNDPHVKAKNLVKKSTSSIKETFQDKWIEHLNPEGAQEYNSQEVSTTPVHLCVQV